MRSDANGSADQAVAGGGLRGGGLWPVAVLRECPNPPGAFLATIVAS
jgi:hypothetical protein